MSSTMSSVEQRDFAKKQLIHSEIARDSLPYHRKFDELYHEYKESGLPELSQHDYWLLLSKTGKKGGARQIIRTRLPVVPSTEAEKVEILRLIPHSTGERDHMPYTEAFDHAYGLFKKHTKSNIDKNDFWRLVLKITKNSRRPQPIDINPGNELSESLLTELHAMNPWWRGNSMGEVPLYKRNIYSSLFDSVTCGRYKITALRGPRQVGKTVLQKQMIRDLLEKKRMVSPQQVLRIQFEQLSVLEISDPILTIIRWFEKNVVKDTFNNMAAKGLPVYIFLDEFQVIPNWNSQLKHFTDLGECRVFITGSSALNIAKGKESLAGRVEWMEINSLGLSEICEFRQLGSLSAYRTEVDLSEWTQKEFWLNLKNGRWKTGDKQILLDSVFESFCDFGGYPFCHTTNEISWREAENYLYETVVARTIDLDLQSKFESEHGESTSLNRNLLINAFRVFCKYSGRDISLEKLRQEFVSAYSESLTTKKIRILYEFFEQSLLIKVVKPFEHRLKNPKECVKICLCDHAIRKAWLKEGISLYGSDVNADLAGSIVEGIIGTFFKSIKHLGVSYFPAVGRESSTEGEVDYILEIGVHHIPVEVKYKNKPDLGPGMKSFLSKEAYNAPFGLIITKDELPTDYFGGTENIIPISAKKLLILK